MRSQIILTIFLVASLIQCDQSPTSFDKAPFLDGADAPDFKADITSFEFDYLYKQFFFSVRVNSPNPIDEVRLALWSQSVHPDSMILNDAGLEGDIIAGDGNYNGNWGLPDSILELSDSLQLELINELWNIEVRVRDINMQETIDQYSFHPVVPAAPVIGTIWHRDTLQLVVDSLLLDTLSVEVTHPKGLDEIRDVWLMSRKPDSTWSNQKQPIHLYDDGGTVVFFNYKGVDFTSGDKVRGDGIYSLMVGFENDQFTQVGTYYRTFYARSWFGLVSEPVADTLVLLAPANLSFMKKNSLVRSGIFQ
ncbi:MAG: hypothetical protein K9M55_08405 [Candidatus Marinimicrobia bacterium]|nr:hypothetical protein [Candidatus Neomarinimicrobiota bacterium]MCF7922709.1 hypothetical protein [Candidatus Neomarinimicrobiota bacterium]